MTLTAPHISMHELCRQYLSLKRRIDHWPSESYFQAPLDLVARRDQLRNIILSRQSQRRREVSHP